MQGMDRIQILNNIEGNVVINMETSCKKYRKRK